MTSLISIRTSVSEDTESLSAAVSEDLSPLESSDSCSLPCVSLVSLSPSLGWVTRVRLVVNYSAEAEFLDEIQKKSLLFTVTSTALPWDFYFFKLTQPLTVSLTYPLPYGLRNQKSIQKPQVWELSRLCPETSMKLYVHEFGISRMTEISFLISRQVQYFNTDSLFHFHSIQKAGWLISLVISYLWRCPT